MKFLITVSVLLLIVTLADVKAQAIFEVTGGPIDPVAVLLNLYTNYPYFSATATVTVDEEGATNRIPITIRYAVADDKISSDFNITQLVPESANLFKQMGIDQVRSVFSIHTNEALVIYPSKNGYYKLTLPSNAPHLAPKQTQKDTLAVEKTGGHDRQHCRFSVTAEGETKLIVDTWEAKELNGFPVQLTYSTEYFYVVRTQKATVSVSFDEIKFIMPGRTNFFPPEDSKLYTNRNALMAAPAPKR